MPGLISHYIFAKGVLERLPKEVKKDISEENVYNLGGQGPDIFFYYLKGLGKKRLRNIGTIMHKSNVNDFIMAMIDQLYSLKGKEKEIYFSYIAGYITHYTLDRETHPYIYYKTGIRTKDINTSKYSIYHNRFENAIDGILLRKLSSKKVSEVSLWRLIYSNGSNLLEIGKMVSLSIEEAYGKKVYPKEVVEAMWYMKSITRILQSKKGRRKKFMKLLESYLFKNRGVSELIHVDDEEYNFKIDYLNLEKKEWYLPYDKSASKNESFLELFDKAMESALFMIESIYEYENYGITRDELKKIIDNKSLTTGVSCEEEVEFKYFDLVFER